MRLRRLAGWCGLAGPALFTAAWVVSSLRQASPGATGVQLSGLAAQDARDPGLMMSGFVVLGTCSAVFGAGLLRVTAPRRAGAWLVIGAGVATAAAGVFRRDHMLLTGPGFTGESWHNQVHDVASGVAYAAMLAAPLVLAHSFRRDPALAPLSRPLCLLAVVAALAFAVFTSRLLAPWNGTVQRVAVTLPLIAEILVAARMLALDAAGPAGPGTVARR